MADMSTIVAALVGSLAGGVGHYLLARRFSRAGRDAMRTGLVAEIAVLHRLLALQFETPSPQEGGVSIFPIAYHGELATVYDALSAKLGTLEQGEADRIVRFHTLCKTIMGIAERQGPEAIAPGLVQEALELGAVITRGR